jgi:squalene synthase HpnC
MIPLPGIAGLRTRGTRLTKVSTFEAEQLGLDAAMRRGTLPDTIRAAFAPVDDPPAAEKFTRALVQSHYENFSVISHLLPKHLRQDFCNVYAFCRVADDLGDEVGDRELALRYLSDFRRQLEAGYQGQAKTAVFVALRQTVQRHNIPLKPFDDLIRAFEQDQVKSRYNTFAEVVDYCTRSADPVGRIVLYMCGCRDEPRQLLSDKTCTALQLVNFWQDVRRDMLERDRIYLPAEDLRRFGISEEQLRAGRVNDAFRNLIRFEVERTEGLFAEGRQLLPLLDSAFRKQIALFGKGGMAICQAIRRQNFDTLTARPRLSKWQKTRLMLGTLLGGAA